MAGRETLIDLYAGDKKLDGIGLVIFDKDGTLFQLYPFCSNMVFRRARAVCEMLGNTDDRFYGRMVDLMGVDVAGARIYPGGPIGVYSRYYAQEMVRDRLTALGYSVTVDDVRGAFEKADLLINSGEDMARSLVPVPGMLEFVRALKGKCKCAVLSNDVTPRLLQTVRMFGIEDCFDMILGGDRLAKHKPDPLGAVTIMDALGVGPELTALIGDSAPDMEMGRRAGCRHIIAVRSDITGIAAIAQSGALLVDDFRAMRVQQVI